jgi:hypothetical protein
VPTLYKGDAQVVTEDQAEIEGLLASGWSLPPTAQGMAIERGSGAQTVVDPELAPYVLGQHQAVGTTEQVQGGIEAQREANYGGANLGTALAGAASVLTLSGSDWALDAAGVPIKEYSEHNPLARTTGELGATVLTALSGVGGLGGVGKALTKLPGGAIAKFGAGGKTALARVAHTVGEGAAYGVAQASTNLALAEPGVAAENWLSELGQGAILGMALGGAAGGIGEGARVLGAARAARRGAALDLDNGPGRDAVTMMAKAQDDLDRSLFEVGRGSERVATETADHLAKERTTNLVARVAEVQDAVNKMRPATSRKLYDDAVAGDLRYFRDALDNGLAKGEGQLLSTAESVFNSVNKAAQAVGSPQIPRTVMEGIQNKVLDGIDATKDMAKLVAQADALLAKQSVKVVPKHGDKFARADKLFAQAQKSGKAQDQLNYLTAIRKMADEAGAKELSAISAQHIADNIAAATKADEILGGMRVKLPKSPVQKIFKLREGEKLGPDAFKRLLKSVEKDPKGFGASLKELDDYHAAALAAAKGNEVETARIMESFDAFKVARDNLIPKETQKLLDDPTIIQTILGAEVLLPEDTPGKSLLHLAAAYKLAGGVMGRMGGRSKVAQAINAIGRRFSAGMFSGAARNIPAVKNMGPMMQTGIVGGAAGGGYNFYNWAQKTFFGGARAAVGAQDAVRAGVAGAVQRVAKGSPVKARAMPATTVILDKLLGDPEQASKTPQEKFKVIQQRLSSYAVAPDAALAKVYELLQPVAQISEQLADLMETVLGVQLSYLQSKMPQDPGTMVMFGKSFWQPTDRDLYEFSMHAMGVLMPLETVNLIADGLVPPQAAEALAATNPEIYTKFQIGIMERADDVRLNSTYNQRIALGLAFQLPLDPTTDPRYVAFQQSMHAQKTMDQAAGDSGEGSTPEESYSDAQKLLA